jgi:hypothetical protein
MDPNLEGERQRQAAYRRLGTDDPCCVLCGEPEARCLELHHLAGRAYDDLTVILCRNCHRKQSDPATNARTVHAAPLMDRAGRLALGLVDFLAALIERLRSYGQQLMEGAMVCPWPYGWVGAPTGVGPA